jgi:hypothetical protein
MFLHKYGVLSQECEKRVILDDNGKEELTFLGLTKNPNRANGILT